MLRRIDVAVDTPAAADLLDRLDPDPHVGLSCRVVECVHHAVPHVHEAAPVGDRRV